MLSAQMLGRSMTVPCGSIVPTPNGTALSMIQTSHSGKPDLLSDMKVRS